MHRAGVVHQAADSLSRLPTGAADESEIKDDIKTLDEDERPPRVAIEFFQCEKFDTAGMEDSETFAIETGVEESQNFDEEIISPEEFLSEQKKENFCRQMTTTFGLPKFDLSYDQDGLLVCIYRMDGAVQILVPVSLRRRFLQL